MLRPCLILSLLAICVSAWALPPSDAELRFAREWAQNQFFQAGPTSPQVVIPPGIRVLKNHDPLQLDGRNGGPMRLMDMLYENGLYAHASSDLFVQLPKPARRLTAVIGVDFNADTQAGGGSVVFKVVQSREVLFQSQLLRGGGQPGVPISVDLKGKSAFHLIVTDGGDGISCDQSDWANAEVEYTDGSKQFLSTLPILSDRVPDDSLPPYPFSFVYDGKPAEVLLPAWKQEISETKTENGATVTTISWTDPAGTLRVDCPVTTYPDFPVVEWTLRFTNLSSGDSPILEQIHVLDTALPPHPGAGGRDFTFHRTNGGECTPDCYLPTEVPVTDSAATLAPNGGRPSDGIFPYFNFDQGSAGWIVVVGWPGQWSASFRSLDSGSLKIDAGQQSTKFKLLPGESVTQPTLVVLPWVRSHWLEAQNVWRAWFIKYNAPRVDGKVVESFLSGCSSFIYGEMIHANTANQIACIEKYLAEGIPLDYWWMDAGWYPCDGSWGKTGTWEVDRARFPNGFAEIADRCEPKGVKNLVWFEPERVHGGTWISSNHPEWCSDGGAGGLFKIGDPQARTWLTDHIDRMLKENKIRFYRQDFNIAPLAAWKKWDTPDRVGISEIRHVEGYLAYWDELVRRNPGLRIDSCASGGRRNDLLTMRRAVPLCRSDYWGGQTSMQTITCGIALWLPFHGSNMSESDVYNLRSRLFPYPQQTHNVTNDSVDFDALRSNLKIWREYLVPLYDKDFYPITPVTLDPAQWIGWEHFDPQTGTGAIQMFRRESSPFLCAEYRLFGLEPDARYEFTDLDTNEKWTHSGQQLLTRGLRVTMEEPRSAKIFVFEKQ